jgi:hypothetical protein
MSGTRGGVGRIVAMGIALALALAIAAEARAGMYTVAQCGWYVGADAAWGDTTGGAKFRPDAFCVPGPPADPFDGSHVKSFTRDGEATVSGTRFARWRWTAPPGTGIRLVRGSWWHALHDGLEQRLGTDPGDGTFAGFGAAGETDLTPREFAVGFALPQLAFEDRLLCARAEARSCDLGSPSWSSLRALTITIEDDAAPVAALGGALLGGGWHSGVQGIDFAANDLGGGSRFAETFVDGARIDLTEYPCAKALLGGEWRGTQMQPCPAGGSGAAAVDTTRFSDGQHLIHHCVTDFAGNLGCTGDAAIGTDNNPPAEPHSVSLAGGEAWRRVDDFDLSWADPAQGPASPIWGAYWRITGPGGYDSGVGFLPGRDVAALADRTTPAAGAYSLHLWLRDEAGNSSPSNGVDVPMRFDDVAPRVAFEPVDGAPPAQLLATVADAHSGPASGSLSYRRGDSQSWTELVAKLLPTGPGAARLVAPMPDLAPGAYVFRADVADAAGNTASTTLRGDGREMAIQKAAPVELAKAKTRLFAQLLSGGAPSAGGDVLTVPFGATATLSGRLLRATGAGLAAGQLRIVSRPSRGALGKASTDTVTTGEGGGFELRLAPGPSRRLSVAFAGGPELGPATRGPLRLRVRSRVSLEAAPRRLRTGETVRLSGEVGDRDAPIPRRGKLVAIQYLEEATGHWRPVLVTRSDHQGRFHARYRFRYVNGSALIRLRATALAEERWPYAPGSSRPVTVEVDDR